MIANRADGLAEFNWTAVACTSHLGQETRWAARGLDTNDTFQSPNMCAEKNMIVGAYC